MQIGFGIIFRLHRRSRKQWGTWALKARNASAIGTTVTVVMKLVMKSSTRQCGTSPGDRVSTTSASPADLPDTTVAIHLDPDTEPPEAPASLVVIAGTTFAPLQVAAPTVDAATDTTSVPLAASMTDIATDGPVPLISGPPTMVECFAITVESLSSEDSENLPVLSSARPEAVVCLTTGAV